MKLTTFLATVGISACVYAIGYYFGYCRGAKDTYTFLHEKLAELKHTLDEEKSKNYRGNSAS